MLPNFLSVGAQRAGTTWLYGILASHPEIYVPKRRKEVHFFDWYYDRGIDWYMRFFPSDSKTGKYRAVGEVTPDYLHDSNCPSRIREFLPYVNLIAILRNPVDRAYSHYRMVVRDGVYRGSFEKLVYDGREMIERDIIQRGFYSHFIERYLHFFDKNRLLVLIFEQAVKDPENTKQKLASFLSVDDRLFPASAGREKINPVKMPKARSAYAIAKKASEKLRELDIDWIVNLSKQLGMQRLFGETEQLPPLGEDIRAYLTDLYRSDIQRLESILQIELTDWSKDS